METGKESGVGKEEMPEKDGVGNKLGSGSTKRENGTFQKDEREEDSSIKTKNSRNIESSRVPARDQEADRGSNPRPRRATENVSDGLREKRDRGMAKIQSFGRSNFSATCLEQMRAQSPPKTKGGLSGAGREEEMRRQGDLLYDRWKEVYPSALSSFEEISKVIGPRQLAVFLDYDGTLSPIVEDPDKAFMSEAMRSAVSEVASLFPTAIISGRDREKVFNFVKLSHLYYAGSHGMDIMVPLTLARGRTTEPEPDKLSVRTEENYRPLEAQKPAHPKSSFLPIQNEDGECSNSLSWDNYNHSNNNRNHNNNNNACSKNNSSEIQGNNNDNNNMHIYGGNNNDNNNNDSNYKSNGECGVGMSALEYGVKGIEISENLIKRKNAELLCASEGVKISAETIVDARGRQVVVFQAASHFVPIMDDIFAKLKLRTQRVPGSHVENNKFCVSVHFRRVAEEYWEELADIVTETVEKYGNKLRTSHGRKVLEIRPVVQWDKGKALSYLLNTLGLNDCDSVCPLYIGDDRTDEDAFKVLREQGFGFGVVVTARAKESVASYSLRDPAEVMIFLNQLVVWRKLQIQRNEKEAPSCKN